MKSAETTKSQKMPKFSFDCFSINITPEFKKMPPELRIRKHVSAIALFLSILFRPLNKCLPL